MRLSHSFSYVIIVGYYIHLRVGLGLALVRATVLCLCGSRTCWRSLGFEDGAAI